MKAWYICEEDRLNGNRKKEKTAQGKLVRGSEISFESANVSITVKSVDSIDLVPMAFPRRRILFVAIGIAALILTSVYLAFKLSPGAEMSFALWMVMLGMAAFASVGFAIGATLYSKVNSVVQVNGVDTNDQPGTWNFGGYRFGDGTRISLWFAGLR